MRSRTKEIYRAMAESLGLPVDLALDLPRVIVVGAVQVIILNHRGLIQYSKTKLVAGVGGGQVVVDGEDLEIQEIGPEDMAVKGVIRSVHMET